GEGFEIRDAVFAKVLGVGHDMRLRHRYESGSVEELADRDLVPDRPPPRLAGLPGQHRLFFVGEAHRRLFSRRLDKAMRTERRRVKHETFEGLVAGGDDFVGQAFRDADHRAGAATARWVLAERDIGLALQDIDHLRLADMVMAAGLATRRDLPEHHLETRAEFAIDEAAVDRARM